MYIDVTTTNKMYEDNYIDILECRRHEMDVNESKDKNYREFLCAIINQSILDSLLCRRPRHPTMLIKKHTKKKCHMYLYNIMYLLKYGKNDTILTITKYFQPYIAFLINEAKKDIITMNERLSFDARTFMSSKNKLFCHYCSLLDIDPLFLESKINKHLKRFDNGEFRVRKNLY